MSPAQYSLAEKFGNPPALSWQASLAYIQTTSLHLHHARGIFSRLRPSSRLDSARPGGSCRSCCAVGEDFATRFLIFQITKIRMLRASSSSHLVKDVLRDMRM
jgi:hypothetical protein